MGLRDIINAILFQFAGATKLFLILLSFHIVVFLAYYIIKDSFKSPYNKAVMEITNTTLDPFYDEVEFLLESIKEAKHYDSLIRQLPYMEMIEFGMASSRMSKDTIDTYDKIHQIRSDDLSEIKRYLNIVNLTKIASKLDKQKTYKEKYKEDVGIRHIVSSGSLNRIDYNDKIVLTLDYENLDQLETHITSLISHSLNNFAEDLIKYFNMKIKIFLNDNEQINELIQITQNHREINDNKDFELAIKMLNKTKDTIMSLNIDSIQDASQIILNDLNIKTSVEEEVYLPGTIEAFVILLFSQFILFSLFNFLIKYYNQNKII